MCVYLRIERPRSWPSKGRAVTKAYAIVIGCYISSVGCGLPHQHYYLISHTRSSSKFPQFFYRTPPQPQPPPQMITYGIALSLSISRCDRTRSGESVRSPRKGEAALPYDNNNDDDGYKSCAQERGEDQGSIREHTQREKESDSQVSAECWINGFAEL